MEENNLRDRVRQQLTRMMLSGELSPGSWLPLARIARELEVSVTPIREALTQLEQAHVVRAERNRGFFLRELERRAANDLYPVVAALEATALKTGQHDRSSIAGLRSAQQRMINARTPLQVVKQDLAFHQRLTAPCGNRLLLGLLKDLKLRLFFFELEYLGNKSRLERSIEEHEEIMTCLATGAAMRSAALVEKHWLNALHAGLNGARKSQ